MFGQYRQDSLLLLKVHLEGSSPPTGGEQQSLITQLWLIKVHE